MYKRLDRYHFSDEKDYDINSKEKIKLEFEVHNFGDCDYLYGQIGEVIKNLQELEEDLKDEFDELVMDTRLDCDNRIETYLIGIRYETDEEYRERQEDLKEEELQEKLKKLNKKNKAKEKRKKEYERLRKEFEEE